MFSPYRGRPMAASLALIHLISIGDHSRVNPARSDRAGAIFGGWPGAALAVLGSP